MKHIQLGILFLILFASCSSKYGIVNAEAYIRKITAGTVKVDRNGGRTNSGVSYQHLIYVETDTSRPLPQWRTVWANGQSFAASAVEVKTPNQVIGKTVDGKDAIVNAKAGNRLWQLVLTPITDSAFHNRSVRRKIEKNPVVITGIWKNKEFAYEFSREKELQPLDMQ